MAVDKYSKNFEKSRSKGSCWTCLTDVLRTIPFFSIVWCAALLFLLFAIRRGSTDLWALDKPLDVNLSTARSYFELGVKILAGLNIASLLLILFTSGKLLELWIGSWCGTASCAHRCGGASLVSLIAVAYGLTFLAIPVFLALEVVVASVMIAVLLSSVACDGLAAADVQSLANRASEALSRQIPNFPRLQLDLEQVGPVCTALDKLTEGTITVILLGFFAVLVQVLFSTSVFSRLWAARTELRDARLRSKARKAATTTDTLYGPSTHAPNREEHKFAGTEPAAYAYVDPISSSL